LKVKKLKAKKLKAKKLKKVKNSTRFCFQLSTFFFNFSNQTAMFHLGLYENIIEFKGNTGGSVGNSTKKCRGQFGG